MTTITNTLTTKVSFLSPLLVLVALVALVTAAAGQSLTVSGHNVALLPAGLAAFVLALVLNND